ncbi:hypothetical protein OAX78_04755 [Planctomycetota bacterium]|nr:hypothetical protein [Planctomycetota bacterium]
MQNPEPVSAQQLRDALAALLSGANLDPPLAEQQALAARGERGVLAELHVWLVVGIALRATERCLGPRPSEPSQRTAFDLALRARVTAGYPGLLKAQRDWDPTKGYKFGTYASFWIRQELRRAGLSSPPGSSEA